MAQTRSWFWPVLFCLSLSLFPSGLSLTGGPDANTNTNTSQTRQDLDLDLESELFEACQDGNLLAVQAALAKGANISSHDDDRRDHRSGFTALHYAAMHDHFEVVQELLERGADVDARDQSGRMPLHWAATRGGLEVVRLLVEKGADVTARDKGGWTPLHMAPWGQEALKVIPFLLRKGADVNARTKDGETPLHFAVVCQSWEVSRLLLEEGAELESRDKDGRTPLFKAAEGAFVEQVKFLLRKGADPHLRDIASFCAADQPQAQVRPVYESLLPCNRAGWDWLRNAAASPRFWQALALAVVLSYASARWLGGSNKAFEPEAPLGARLLAAQAVYSPGALLAVQLYRALEILSNTVLPMLLMLRLLPALWISSVLLLYGLAAVVTALASGEHWSPGRLLLGLLRSPMLVLSACRHSLLRLGSWDRQLLGLLWAPGRLLLLYLLFTALAPPLDEHCQSLWCNSRGQLALRVTSKSPHADICLPLPQRLSSPLQMLLWHRRPPWRIAEGECTRDDSTFCIQSPHFPQNYTAGEDCLITVPRPATFQLDTRSFHTRLDLSGPRTTVDLLRMGDNWYFGEFGPPHAVPVDDLNWTTDSSIDGEERGWQFCPGKRMCFAVWSVGHIWKFLEDSVVRCIVIIYAVASMLLLAAALLMRAFHRNWDSDSDGDGNRDRDRDEAVASVTAEILATIKNHPAPEPASTAVSQIKGRGGRTVQPTSVLQVVVFLLLDLLLDMNTVRVLLVSENYFFAAIIAAASIGSTMMVLRHGGLSGVRRAIDETRRTGVPTAAYLDLLGDEKGEACVSLLLTSYSMAFSVRLPLDLISTSLSLLSSSWSLASYFLQELDIVTTGVELESESESSSESGDKDSDSSSSCSAA